MPWIAIDCDMDTHRKIAALSEDEARWGWVVLLMRAKRQREPGRFASLEHLRYVLGDDLGAYVEEYVKARLLTVTRNGAVTVHGWGEYQRDKPDRTAAERQRRFRERKRNAPSNGVTTVTGNASHAHASAVVVPVPVDVSSTEERVQGEEPSLNGGEAAVFAFLAQHGAAIREDSGYGRRLLGLMERRTPERVLETAWDMAPGDTKLSDRQWTFGLEGRLEPPEDGREAAKAERAAEQTRQSQRGFEATQRYIRELRGETEPKAGVA